MWFESQSGHRLEALREEGLFCSIAAMRAALIVNQVTGDLETDLSTMEALARRAGRGKADLILFPEAAPTGLRNNDDPIHDLPIGDTIPGPITERLSRIARETRAHIASGILERAGDTLFDTSLILDPDGGIILKYRRISPGWHGAAAAPGIYLQGKRVESVKTPLGKLAVLICGDLFHEAIIEQVRQARPDYLLYSVAASFDEGTFAQELWHREAEPDYRRQAELAGCTTLMANLLEDPGLCKCPAYGGATIFSPAGKVLQHLSIGKPGVLLADI
ncbi:carbon-nitrogen hydrolase family protein [Elusimicrobiota bacterium]